METFGRSNLFQLSSTAEGQNNPRHEMPRHLRGRYLFEKGATFERLTARFGEEPVVKKNRITEEFSYDDLKSKYGPDTVPVFLVTESGALQVVSAADRPDPKPGDTLYSLIDANAEADIKEQRKAVRSEEARERAEESEGKDGQNEATDSPAEERE